MHYKADACGDYVTVVKNFRFLPAVQYQIRRVRMTCSFQDILVYVIIFVRVDEFMFVK